MKAAWWWIDRWRKSTAYTDMTLAEQGAYRNLLDELWLRDGAIPNDERILAKVCGDPFDWPKVREKVLARFRLTEDGWRNDTHDSIHKESKRLAQKQADYRARNAPGVTGNVTGDVTRSPSPSPSPSVVSVLTDQRIATTADAVSPFPSSKAADIFLARYPQGTPPGAMFKALRPLVVKHGWDRVAPELEAYLGGTEMQFQSWPKFAAGFGTWATKRGEDSLSPLSRHNMKALGLLR